MDKHVYAGGYPELLEWFAEKQDPFEGIEDVLPTADVALEALASATVLPRASEPSDHPGQSLIRKRVSLQKDFEGQSELLLLHALLIAILRRRDPPELATGLFFRIWREHGASLAGQLNVRWMISAATTFADHGLTADQRTLGMGLSIMFDLIKLHDSERRLSGQSGRKPFARTTGWRKMPLAFDLDPYSLKGGDLDKNMLSRLWSLSEKDSVIKPLAQSMLELVMTDRKTVFARVQRIKMRNNALELVDRLSKE